MSYNAVTLTLWYTDQVEKETILRRATALATKMLPSNDGGRIHEIIGNVAIGNGNGATRAASALVYENTIGKLIGRHKKTLIDRK